MQNRVAQAQPNLPTDVIQYGLTTRKSTGLPMLIISIFSPNNTYDALFLANYAININDVLYRVPGVGEVRLFGASDYAMRIWVKPDVLAKLEPPCRTSPTRSGSRAPSTPPARWARRRRQRALRRRTRSARRGGSRRRRSLAASSSAPTRTAPSCVAGHGPLELGALNYQQRTRTGQPAAAIAIFQFPAPMRWPPGTGSNACSRT